MIVEPDFLDHWKTRLLVRLLGAETAPIHVLRLWAHCQCRKTDRFTGWKPIVLASVCRWESDVQTFWDAMVQTFIEIEGDAVVVHGWAATNASLISAWNNGKLGGRPSKSTTEKPTGNPPVIPQQTDRVTDRVDREEKRRLEGQDINPPTPLQGELANLPQEQKKAPSATVTPPAPEKPQVDGKADESEPESEWSLIHGVELPVSLRTPECLAAAKEWLAHKKENRSNYKPRGIKGAVAVWAEDFTAQTFPPAVHRSIANNYKGIFKDRFSTTYEQPRLFGTNTPDDSNF